MSSDWLPSEFWQLVAGIGSILQWSTFDVIDVVIDAFISGGKSVKSFPRCLVICWAQSSALTIHDGVSCMTSTTHLLLLTTYNDPYDAFRVVRPLALLLLRVFSTKSGRYPPPFMHLPDIIGGFVRLFSRVLMCAPHEHISTLRFFLASYLLRWSLLHSCRSYNGNFRDLSQTENGEKVLFRSPSCVPLHVSNALTRRGAWTAWSARDFRRFWRHYMTAENAKQGFHRPMSDGARAGFSSPWPLLFHRNCLHLAKLFGKTK